MKLDSIVCPKCQGRIIRTFASHAYIRRLAHGMKMCECGNPDQPEIVRDILRRMKEKK